MKASPATRNSRSSASRSTAYSWRSMRWRRALAKSSPIPRLHCSRSRAVMKRRSCNGVSPCRSPPCCSRIVLLVLMALFSLGALVAELDAVGKGGYTLVHAAEYVLLSMPRLAYQLFPVVALLGSVIGLGMMASNNELLVMRAAGVSVARVALSVLKIGVVWMLLALVLGEYVAPPAEKYAQAMRATAMSARFAITSGNGLWARDGRMFIHVRDVLSQEDVKGVSIYEFDDQRRLRQMTVAEAGHYTGDEWRLTGVARSRIDSAHETTEHLNAISWRSLLNPDMIEVVAVKPDSLSITGLIGYIRYLADNGLSVDRYALALWSKLVLPITTMVMLFLSIPFIFGPLRSVGVGQRIFYGVLVGFGFFLIDKTFSFVGLAYAFPTAISATLPTILFLILAVIMMMRVR